MVVTERLVTASYSFALVYIVRLCSGHFMHVMLNSMAVDGYSPSSQICNQCNREDQLLLCDGCDKG